MRKATFAVLFASLACFAMEAGAQTRTRVDSTGSTRGPALHEQRGTGVDLTVPDVSVDVSPINQVPVTEIQNMDLNAGPTSEIIPFVDRDLPETVGNATLRDAMTRQAPGQAPAARADANTVNGAVREMSAPQSSMANIERTLGVNAARPGGNITPENLNATFENNLHQGDLAALQALNVSQGLPAATDAAQFDLRATGLRRISDLPAEQAKRPAVDEDPLAVKVPDVIQVLGNLKRNSIENNDAFNAEIARRGIPRDSAFLVREGAPELLFLFKEGDLIRDGARGVARTFKSDSQGLELGPLLIVSASEAARPEALRRAIHDAVVSVSPAKRDTATEDSLVLKPTTGEVPELSSDFRRHDLKYPGALDPKQLSPIERAKLTLRQAANTVSSWVQRLALLFFPSQHATAAG